MFAAVCVAFALYLVYLLRKPISWVLIAIFLAVALAGPVNRLPPPHEARVRDRDRLPRAACSYRSGSPPPSSRRSSTRATPDPEPADYAHDAQDFTQKNATLRKLEKDYNITGKLQGAGSEAARQDRQRRQRARRHRARPRQLAVRRLHDPRADRVPARQRPHWVERFLELRPPEEAARIRKALDHMARTVGGYVAALSSPRHDRRHQRVHSCSRSSASRSPPRWRSSCFSPTLIPLVGATLGRDRRRDRHAVHRLPDGHDHLGDLLRCTTSSSRTR